MAIKEMPIEERYDRLLDDYLLDIATDYALLKEFFLGSVSDRVADEAPYPVLLVKG